MRFSPRFLIFLPVAGAILSVGQVLPHSFNARTALAAPDPLGNLPLPPTQSGGTLGGPLQNLPTQPPGGKPVGVPMATGRPFVKPTPTLVPALPTPVPSSSKNIIRVGLSTQGGPLQLWLPEGAVLRDLDQPARKQSVAANSTLVFGYGAVKPQKVGATTFNGPLTVQVGATTSLGWSKIAIQPLGGGFGRATSNGKSARYGRPYRGTFEVAPQRSAEVNHRKGPLAFINVVGLEDYLKGVVPWEMSPTAPMEALKAQAICARTKTLDFKTSGRYQPGGFDVCDYDACQGYPGTENEKDPTSDAVEATAGLALFYNGRPIDAVYSTNSGGLTAAASEVWRGEVPYLKSVRDFPASSPLDDILRGPMNEAKWGQFVAQPYPSYARPDGVSKTAYESRKYRWTQFVSVDEASRAFAAQGISRVLNISVESRGASGRAWRVKVTGVDAARAKSVPTPIPQPDLKPTERATDLPLKSVTLESDGPIRSMFSKQLGSTTALPSSLFVITPQADAQGEVTGWNIAGAGWGHGVGMCQRGAQNHAAEGWDARRILNWYYKNVDLRSIS
ncbi:SpoIID/LytB domain-containing protein [bacterium]|nr:MAG: SpoIID/LytB domain-containing protein [bacterium]